jgi:hypothetical protein
MRFALLIVLAACGDESRLSDRSEPVPTKPPPSPVVACKNGETVCNGDQVAMCEDGAFGRTVTTCRGGCKQGACVDTCGANDVELIYVVDTDRTLFSFDPRKLPGDPFKQIGVLACDQRSTPFSMAVDRSGIAWVLYQTGVLYQVSILDGHCLAKASEPEGAPRTFGMGFVTDGPKATTEQLFVASDGETSALATLDTLRFPARWKEVGTIERTRSRSPELTGTAEGKLYGYFPGDPGRGFVQEIDRRGKLIGKRWNLPGNQGRVNAWAFAFWGDVFYVFLTLENTNEVHAIHRKTGKHEQVKADSPHRIVGAGVSTCAPLLEKPL